MRTLWERAGRPVPLLPMGLISLLLVATTVTPRGIELIRPVAQSGGDLRVTTTADRPPGSCQVDDCTLREALQVAAAQPGTTTITVPAGTHQLTRAGSGEDANQAGDLDASGQVIVRGAGADATTIDASGLPTADRVFDEGLVGTTAAGRSARRGLEPAASTGRSVRLGELRVPATLNTAYRVVVEEFETYTTGSGVGGAELTQERIVYTDTIDL